MITIVMKTMIMMMICPSNYPCKALIIFDEKIILDKKGLWKKTKKISEGGTCKLVIISVLNWLIGLSTTNFWFRSNLGAFKSLFNCFGLLLFSLKDIDECMEYTFQCQDASQTCSNIHGSYKCVCGEDLYWIDNKCQGLLAKEFSCYLTHDMAWIWSDLSMVWTHLSRIV